MCLLEALFYGAGLHIRSHACCFRVEMVESVELNVMMEDNDTWRCFLAWSKNIENRL